jgi:nucleotide-binding universal stress UspA family protein
MMTMTSPRTTEKTRAEPRPRVLVALSASGAPHGAVGAGRLVARLLAAPLHGMLVWPTAITPCEVPRLLRVDPQALAGMVLDVDVGDPAERVGAAALAHPIAFLVVAAEEGGPDVCGVGDVAARLLDATHAGAILLRPGATLSRIQRILVPLDGTPSTAAALRPAGELADRAGAGLDLVLVEDVCAPPSREHGAMAPPRYVDQPQHEWPAFSAEFVRRFAGAVAHCPEGVPTRFFLGTGHPADEILRFAESLDTDLIALVRGACACGHGAVFQDVVRRTRRPVLVLRR